PPQHPNGDFILANQRVYAPQQHGNTIEQQGAEQLTFAGISVLSPKLFANLEHGTRPLAPLLRQAMQAGQVSGTKLTEAWVDVGTPERLCALDQQIKAQKI